jgi:hypothetical protein
VSLTLYLFGIASAVTVLAVVFDALRRGRLRERHALWWLIAGTLALVTSVFPGILQWAASLIGVETPSNLAFFVTTAVLFLVSIQQSAELTRLEAKTRRLAEAFALVELRMRHLEGEAEPNRPGEAERGA